MKKFFKLFLIFGLLIILSGCDFQTLENLGGATGSLTGMPGVPGVVECFRVEENVFFPLIRNDYKPGINVRYVRVFANAMIPAYKIGDTTKKIKSIGVEPLPQNEIHSYTEAGNWQFESMDPFLLVRLQTATVAVGSQNEVAFDVYVDEEIIKTDSLPDFVKNCQPRGGTTLVQVPPAGSFQAEMPNAFFEKEKINFSGFEQNYSSVSAKLKPYYVKVGEVPQIQDNFLPIGRITMTSESSSQTYEVFFHLEVIFLTDGTKVFQYEGTQEIPTNQGVVSKTLKLDTIRFVTLGQWNWFTPECKPVIYFYPADSAGPISLKVFPRGFLTVSEPEYKNGWENLWLKPTGEIFYQGKIYPYLHYEAMIGDFAPPKTGYLVKKENLSDFFDEILPKVGLNEKEARDFKDYWLSRLTGYPYFQVSLLEPEQIEEIEPIVFSKPPQTFIRVRFYFQGLDFPVKIDPPQLIKPTLRKGFTVVEWGGLYD